MGSQVFHVVIMVYTLVGVYFRLCLSPPHDIVCQYRTGDDAPVSSIRLSTACEVSKPHCACTASTLHYEKPIMLPDVFVFVL